MDNDAKKIGKLELRIEKTTVKYLIFCALATNRTQITDYFFVVNGKFRFAIPMKVVVG